MRARPLAMAALLLAGGAARAAPCPVPGDPVHWVADWCMAQLQTDDEIPASDCIAAHPVSAFPSACAAKRHFKRELCVVLRGRDAARRDIERCVADPAVMGRTVRQGGVGGR